MFFVARGLAILLLMQAAAAVVSLVFFIDSGPGRVQGFMQFGLLAIIQACVMFLLAGLLWRNAGRFFGSARRVVASQAVDIRGLLRVVMFGIALLMALSSFGYVLNLGLEHLFPVTDPKLVLTAPKTPSYGDIITFALAVISLPFLGGISGQRVARVLAYPRLESDEEEAGQH